MAHVQSPPKTLRYDEVVLLDKAANILGIPLPELLAQRSAAEVYTPGAHSNSFAISSCSPANNIGTDLTPVNSHDQFPQGVFGEHESYQFGDAAYNQTSQEHAAFAYSALAHDSIDGTAAQDIQLAPQLPPDGYAICNHNPWQEAVSSQAFHSLAARASPSNVGAEGLQHFHSITRNFSPTQIAGAGQHLHTNDHVDRVSPDDGLLQSTALVNPMQFSQPSAYEALSHNRRGDSLVDRANEIASPSPNWAALRTAMLNGPCTNTWQVPKPEPRRKGKTKANSARVSKDNRSAQPESDSRRKEQTTLCRRLGACLRCHAMKMKCEPNPFDPSLPCLRCEKSALLTRHTLPCLRNKIADATLYRHQDAPYQLFSRRWQSMDLIDITSWASTERRSIQVSQISVDDTYTLEVREFVPEEGDMLEELWKDKDGNLQTHRIPPYAMADMTQSARVIESFIDNHYANYIWRMIGHLDTLLWQTYITAFRHMGSAKEARERELLEHTIRLWVACRLTSNPQVICGDDKLDVAQVTDPASPWWLGQPMPPIIIAQQECIIYSRVLRPESKKVLAQLQKLINAKNKKYWYTIYLVLFVLLHSCSLTTRRDQEYATQIKHKDTFCNPEGIRAHQAGALTMLAYFHNTNRNQHPFKMASDFRTAVQLKELTGLDDAQIAFLKWTAETAKEKASDFQTVRESRAYHHDLFWVSQLFDDAWEPVVTI